MKAIPEVVVFRLPLYARVLARLEENNVLVVSSQELAMELQFTAAQIRKDLSYFGRFGKQGRGYPVRSLLRELRQILGLDTTWHMALVGVGQLGRAILRYDGFTPQGFQIVLAFDADPAKVGRKISNVVIQDLHQLEETLKARKVDIGIVAVPAESAQEVINRLVGCNLKAILNYAPIEPKVPPGVKVRTLDPVPALQTMTFFLRSQT